ncbi:MAG: efflux RND transporter periplasmic adaptor subunit [Bacteroidales bacterium]|nr:efflux RND transporter periplasmic adaptor subunit [Bacteroidales bacterium]
MEKSLKSIYVFTLLLAFLFTSCGNGKNQQGARQNATQVVEGFIVKPSLLEPTITVSGTLKSFEETVLMPDISGRVVMINLPEGKFIKKGTLLVKLFDADLQASLRKLQTQLEIARQTKKRQTELLTVSGISELEYDQTTLQVNAISDDIEVLKAQISKTEVLAPYDGVIGLRNISLGTQVTPSTPLTTIRDANHLKLDFSVPEKYSQDIYDGKMISFSVQGADTSFPAHIMAAENGIEAATRNLRVRAVVNGQFSELRPGVFATVEVPLAIIPDALMIPTQSVIPQERNKKVIVARNGKALFVTILTGTRRSKDIEVVSGLNAGDTIVTTGILFLRPNSILKFSKIH